MLRPNKQPQNFNVWRCCVKDLLSFSSLTVKFTLSCHCLQLSAINRDSIKSNQVQFAVVPFYNRLRRMGVKVKCKAKWNGQLGSVRGDRRQIALLAAIAMGAGRTVGPIPWDKVHLSLPQTFLLCFDLPLPNLICLRCFGFVVAVALGHTQTLNIQQPQSVSGEIDRADWWIVV